jgi:hypothetical protein
MAKKDKEIKETDPTQGGDVAETTQGVTPVVVSNRINSEHDAIELLKREYAYLKGVPVMVTEDRNVFTSEYMSSGANHADRNNLKSFRVQWLD